MRGYPGCGDARLSCAFVAQQPALAVGCRGRDTAVVGRCLSSDDATDHTGRELTLSCGAALDHLRVAMAAAGWGSATERFPNPDEPDHLATLQFRPIEAVTAAHQLRAGAIRRRRTDRLPFGPPTAWPALQLVLRHAVTPHEVLMDVVANDDRPRLAEASQLTKLCAVTTPPICRNCDGGLRHSRRTPRMCRRALWCPPRKPRE